MMNKILTRFLDPIPIVAILRGITPDKSTEVVDCLFDAGIQIVEVPLNSPNALDSIGLISEKYGNRMLVGAGTVLKTSSVREVADVGGQLIVSPCMNLDVINTCVDLDMVSLPGVATPTEAFAALDAGASGLKAFPGEMLSPATIKSWRTVLPQDAKVLPVGGIDSSNMEKYWAAGANGFGIGGALYRQGKSTEDIQADAAKFVSLVKTLGS
jgi:2-dehydro-3-deoxyphosphogalactonate aldolase